MLLTPCIDPGHGARNIGTTAGGIEEKAINLELGVRLWRALHSQGMPAILTRECDIGMSFRSRGRKASINKCEWALSVHANANPDPEVSGAECYVLPGRLDVKLVGQTILNRMPGQLRPGRLIEAVDPNPDKPGDWQEAPIRVLEAYACPAVLVEVGMASNPGDLEIILSEWGKLMIVAAMMAGVARMAEIEAAR